MQTLRLMLVAVLVGSGVLLSGCAKEEKKPSPKAENSDHSDHDDHAGHDH